MPLDTLFTAVASNSDLSPRFIMSRAVLRIVELIILITRWRFDRCAIQHNSSPRYGTAKHVLDGSFQTFMKKELSGFHLY